MAGKVRSEHLNLVFWWLQHVCSEFKRGSEAKHRWGGEAIARIDPELQPPQQLLGKKFLGRNPNHFQSVMHAPPNIN